MLLLYQIINLLFIAFFVLRLKFEIFRGFLYIKIMSDQIVSENRDTGVAEGFEFEEPPECRVVIYNDDFTEKGFVVEILMQVFHKSEPDAVFIMESIHNSGRETVGIYTYDIAVTRASMATARAKKRGFPLRIEVERT